METTNHTAERNRSYTVRRLTTATEYKDFGPNDRPVLLRARRDTANLRKGETIRLYTTSNAGFNGITAMGLTEDGTLVHLGSLGAYDVIR